MNSTVRRLLLAALVACLGLVVWFARGRREAADEARWPAGAPARAEGAASAPAESLVAADLEVPAERVALVRQKPLPTAQQKLMASGTPLGTFRGRLVYASTGQGVPWCGVMLHGVELQDLFCITDAEGRFESKYEMPLERTLVRVDEHRSGYNDRQGALPVVRRSADEQVTLCYDARPTLAFEGAFPAGLDPATLRVRVEAFDGATVMDSERLQLRDGHWFARDDHDFGPGPNLKLAADPVGVLASSSTEEGPAGVPPWRVSLDGDEAVWHGTAVIDSFEGVVSVAPTWEACGAVAITIRGNWTSPPSWSTYVELVCDRDGSNSSNVSALLPALVVVPACFSGLQSGAYTLRVNCDPCSNVEIPVIVRSGEVTNVEARLECPTVVGSIRGEVTSESGAAPSQEKYISVTLVGSDWDRRQYLDFDRSSPVWRGIFEFRDLPAGDFRIECMVGPFGAFGVDSSHPQAARAGDFVRLKVLDRPEYVDVAFRAFDAETGEELSTVHVDYARGTDSNSMRDAHSGDIVVRGFPESGSLWWSVTSPGHLCAEGRIENPPNWSMQAGSKRWIDVRLRRGWSLRCVALEAESYEHLAGAEILVDGVLVAKTDAEGEHLLILPMRPKSLEMRYRDWRDVTEYRSKLDELESCDFGLFEFERP